jgi:hypothetical protein
LFDKLVLVGSVWNREIDVDFTRIDDPNSNSKWKNAHIKFK